VFGLDSVNKLSDAAKAQALVMHMANEEGIPLSQYRQSPELLEQAASAFTSMPTLGIAQQSKRQPLEKLIIQQLMFQVI